MATNIKQLTITVERTQQNQFVAYAYTERKTERHQQQAASAREAVRNLQKALNATEEEFAIKLKFDTASFLNFYSKELPLVGLEQITGINQRQLSHYATGHRKPSRQTAKKIEQAVKAFAKSLNKITIK